MNTQLVGTFTIISEPCARKPAPTTIDEYVQMASPRTREAMITALADIPGTLTGLARYEELKREQERRRNLARAAGRRCKHNGRFTKEHVIAMSGGSWSGVAALRKKVRGVSLTDVLATDPNGQAVLMAVLDRAVLRQVAGVIVTSVPTTPTKRRTI